MLNLSDKWRAATAAVIATFALNSLNVQAAEPVKHPLLKPEVTVKYGPALSIALAKATGSDQARLDYRAFDHALRQKLAGPEVQRPQSLTSPDRPLPNELVITGIIPPASLYATAPVGVCAEKDGKIVATYSIYPNGDVKEEAPKATLPIAANPAGAFQFACKPHILAYAKGYTDAMNAQTTPPAPTASAGR